MIFVYNTVFIDSKILIAELILTHVVICLQQYSKVYSWKTTAHVACYTNMINVLYLVIFVLKAKKYINIYIIYYKRWTEAV